MSNILIGWLKDHLGRKIAPRTLASLVQMSDGSSVADRLTTHTNDMVANRLYEIYNGNLNTLVAEGFTNILPASHQWVTIGNTTKKPIRDVSFIVADGADGKYLGLGYIDPNGDILIYNSTSGAINSLYFSVTYVY